MKTNISDNEKAKKVKVAERTAKYAACIVVAFIALFPLYWMITTSFKTAANVVKFPPQWWPNPWTVKNYQDLFRTHPFGRYMWNSLYTAALTSCGVVIFSSLAGYAFAKIKFKGSNILFMIILCGMMMPIEVTILPIYTALAKLKLADNHLSLIIVPMFGYCGAFGTFLMRQFFLTVPSELVQSAKLDGASQLRIFASIMLPMASSSISTLIIFTFMQCWNNYLLPLILMSSPKNYTLPIGLQLLSTEVGVEWQLVMAGASFSTIPILLVFFLCQKKFMASMSMSGMKG